MGAIGEGGVVVLNDEVVAHAHVTTEEIGASVERERTQLIARADRLRRDRARFALRGTRVVIVDDEAPVFTTPDDGVVTGRQIGEQVELVIE